jgi:hypothetical protein
MDDKKLDQLIEALNKNNAKSSSGFDSSGFSALDKKAKDVGESLNPFAKGVGAAKDAFNSIKDTVDKNVGVWQNLSGTGASFNNDVVGMSVAAKGNRLSLDEFANVVKNNSSSFIGLGGSVNQGALMFSKLGKEMYDSGVTDQLKQMGLSNKEVNDTLALQLSFQRSTFKDSKEGHAESIRAATQLATEMDAMAKLTGKSRAEQEDNMRKAAADAQVEAKMRLIGIQQGPEAEAAARKMYAEQYNEAQLRGQGQMFKEVFATGHVMSQEAANQQALLGKQGTETAAQARAVAAGDYAAAQEHNKRAQSEAMANQKDEAKLRQASLGDQGGVASKVYMEQITANRGLYDAEQKIRQESAFKNASNETVLAEAKRRIALEQAGKDKEGRDIAGAGTTKAVVQLQNRIGDVNSALMSGLVKPLNEKVGPALNKVATGPLSGTVERRTPGGKVETVGAGQAYTDTASRSFENAAEGKNKAGTVKGNIAGTRDEGYFGSGAIASAGTILGGISGAAMREVDSLTNKPIAASANAKPQTGQTTETVASKPQESGEKTATLNDVLTQLQELNTHMKNVAGNTDKLHDATNKQVRATKNLSNNRFTQ